MHLLQVGLFFLGKPAVLSKLLQIKGMRIQEFIVKVCYSIILLYLLSDGFVYVMLTVQIFFYVKNVILHIYVTVTF